MSEEKLDSRKLIPSHIRFTVQTTLSFDGVKALFKNAMKNADIESKFYSIQDREDGLVQTKDDAYLTFIFGELNDKEIVSLCTELSRFFGEVRVKTLFTTK